MKRFMLASVLLGLSGISQAAEKCTIQFSAKDAQMSVSIKTQYVYETDPLMRNLSDLQLSGTKQVAGGASEALDLAYPYVTQYKGYFPVETGSIRFVLTPSARQVSNYLTYNDPSGSHDLLVSGVSVDCNPVSSTPDQATCRRYVTELYETLLGRSPSSAEVDFQAAPCISGQLSTSQLRENFLNSQEYRIRTCKVAIGNYYLSLLNRVGTPEEIEWHASFCMSGALSLDQIRANFINSAEYALTH